MGDTAFGAPGIAPTWSSSDKDFVTTALGASRLWVTIGHGIINELYWPSTGQPQTRDVSFYLIGANHWIDLKRVSRYRLSTPGPFLPALTITHYGSDYQLAIEVLPDSSRDVLMLRYSLEGPYRLALILAPHLGSSGLDNNAWTDQGAGFAQRGDCVLCLSAYPRLEQLSCGYVGTSDGWQDLDRHGRLTYAFTEAPTGTVALSAQAADASGLLAIGFSESAHGAHTLVRSALAEGFDSLREQFLRYWQMWGARLTLPRPDATLGDAALLSAAVLKMHEDRTYPGAVVASLSVPWGNSTDSLGGYHLVWPRDATLTAFALLAANQVEDARRILSHLAANQLPDGHWPQNFFPNGKPFWTGIQLDEAAFPILLAAKLRELSDTALPRAVQMVRAAAGFIARHGPSSDQDRWEENPGVSPFTVAIAISALIAAGPWLDESERAYAASLADDWNERLEGWCYVQGTVLAKELGVTGYYVRIAPPLMNSDLGGRVLLRNRDGEWLQAAALVSLDFSYLVRLGLRSAKDPRVQDTIKVVDHVLKVQTPSGGLYHRYNDDGYGEHADGRPFDGSGIGRGWPLLVGERGHLALQAGEDPIEYLRTMWNCASTGGLLPEQVWDADPIPALGLAPGRPSGSAMPLLWTHAEFLKLLVARDRGQPIEQLRSVTSRYAAVKVAQAAAWHWRDDVPVLQLEAGRDLLIEDRLPFTLHLGFDGWHSVRDEVAALQPFGLWGVRLSHTELAGYMDLDFTRHYASGWEGTNHRVELSRAPVDHALPHVG